MEDAHSAPNADGPTLLRAPRGTPSQAPTQASRFVHESVGCFAAPKITEQIIAQAMVMANRHAIPDGRDLRDFVEVHLLAAAQIFLGSDAAEAIQQRLAPLISHYPSSILPPRTSQVRQCRPRDTSGVFSRRTSNASARGLVVLASEDADKASTLQPLLPNIDVITVPDVVSLLDVVRANEAIPQVIVIDAVRATVHPLTLSSVAPDLAAVLAFVMWGSSDASEGWTFALRQTRCFQCPTGTAPSRLAWTLRSYFDRSALLRRPA